MDDLSPGRWDITRTQGDTNVQTSFTLVKDGAPWAPDEVSAQVRVRRDRGSQLVLDLEPDVAVNVVTLGGVPLEVPSGVYWWDLEVVDDDGVLTVLAGRFQVVPDVTHEEASS